jgi:hypothetical protein
MMKRSSNGQAASDRQTGSGDGLIGLIRYAGVPITRENYLNSPTQPPAELSAEEEANLPAMPRRVR